MIVRVDIDETICTKVDDLDYSKAMPLTTRIAKINQLYDAGHTIIYWSSRGMGTGKDWYKITKIQLEGWNAKYHSIELNKPLFDLFIDDKAIDSDDYFGYQ